MTLRAAVLRILTPLCGLATVAAIAACGGSARSANTAQHPYTRQVSSSASKQTARASDPPVTLRTAASAYGRILVDARGRTLYLFTADTAGLSNCAGACARAWPPYIVAAAGRAVSGAHVPLLGVIRRSDGSRQLSYHAHALYYYIGDRAPGDVLCQDVEEYGGHWWVVSPRGQAITRAAPPCRSRR